MDVLSEVLEAVRVSGVSGYRALLRAPWGMAMPAAGSGAPFYVVASGSMYLRLVNGESRLLVEAGDLVMLPGDAAHEIADDPASPLTPFSRIAGNGDTPAGRPPRTGRTDRIETTRAGVIRFGGEGAKTELFTGRFRFDDDPTATFLPALGPVVHIRAKDGGSPDFRTYLGLSCHEQRNPMPGSDIVSAELTKLLFIQVIRSALANRSDRDQTACAAHPFALMFHPRMKRVAEAIHHHPERAWKVEELAEKAGMSRTAFSTRFTEITGSAPLAYLTRWRMVKAAQILRTTGATLSDVASRVGYGSEAAFSIAFKREMGTAPGRYRENTRANTGIRAGAPAA